MQHEFLTTHRDGDPIQHLAFVIPANEADSVYASAMWAVAIQDILADGAKLEPKPFLGRLYDLDFTRIETRGISFVASMMLSEVVVAGRFQSEEDFDLVSYDLQASSTLIEIRYKPRYAPGLYGQDCRLVSTLV